MDGRILRHLVVYDKDKLINNTNIYMNKPKYCSLELIYLIVNSLVATYSSDSTTAYESEKRKIIS